MKKLIKKLNASQIFMILFFLFLDIVMAILAPTRFFIPFMIFLQVAFVAISFGF